MNKDTKQKIKEIKLDKKLDKHKNMSWRYKCKSNCLKLMGVIGLIFTALMCFEAWMGNTSVVIALASIIGTSVLGTLAYVVKKILDMEGDSNGKK